MENIEDLQEAVESDTDSYYIKGLAEFLINAMIDWPTYNQSRISDFVKELEAGLSIAEMIELSTRLTTKKNSTKYYNEYWITIKSK